MNTIDILLVSREDSSLANMAAALTEIDCNIARLSSARQVWAHLENNRVDVAVVSEELEDCPGLQFVKELITRKPFAQCALVSPLPENEFHDATEGYGVFMQLPQRPSAQYARDMIDRLDKIHRLIHSR